MIRQSFPLGNTALQVFNAFGKVFLAKIPPTLIHQSFTPPEFCTIQYSSNSYAPVITVDQTQGLYCWSRATMYHKGRQEATINATHTVAKHMKDYNSFTN